MSKIRIKLAKSPIGKEDIKKTLTGLGLRRIGNIRVYDQTPSIMGAVNKVKHLLKIEQVNNEVK